MARVCTFGARLFREILDVFFQEEVQDGPGLRRESIPDLTSLLR
jgi:hypothetical protein